MSRRRVVRVPGLGHSNPIPLATSIGNLLVTGTIPGRDPSTGEYPRTVDAQCELMFSNIERVMNAAGGTTGDILKLTVWLKDISNKRSLNAEWLRMFPDADSRPARHTLADPNMAEPALVHCEVMAILDQVG